jgi:hypothetical protein
MQDFLDVPFDTENEEGSPAFAPLPRDRYKAEIVKATAGATKNGKGYAVVLNWSITEGDYENRTVFQHFNIQHESAEAQRIGRQQFKDTLVALGIKEKVDDLKVLLNRPCLISVIIREDKSGQYPDRNEVRRVAPIPTSHNGPTREAIREAQEVPASFEAVNGKLNDDIPF